MPANSIFSPAPGGEGQPDCSEAVFEHHGGRIDLARKLYPHAPAPWIDLSTGINPWGYAATSFTSQGLSHLPEANALTKLEDQARETYGAGVSVKCIAAPGSELLISIIPRLLAGQQRVRVLDPTYTSHAEAWRAAGHDVKTVEAISELKQADVAVIVNPNNPDGRIVDQDACFGLADVLHKSGKLLIIDEAFCDLEPAQSLVPHLASIPSVVCLRSFGKFFGLPGLRLGFALTSHPIGDVLRQCFGAWPVSSAAIEVGAEALCNKAWQVDMRKKLVESAKKLDEVLITSGGSIVGGTALFRLLRHSQASALFDHLAEAGILVRPFRYNKQWLRFGLPPTPDATRRLRQLLVEFSL